MTHPESRRAFLGTAAAGALLSSLPHVHAAGSDTLKVGVVGLGGRGTGAVENALKADGNVKLVAVGDMFKDKLDFQLGLLKKNEAIAKKIDVKPENCFVGFDAYKRVIASGIDAILLTTPPGFRPLHLKAAVEAKLHVFCEKPMAVDAPGVRSVIETCKKARDNGTSVVAGFCYRYQKMKKEWIERIHAGDIGDITALHCIYHAGQLWNEPRQKGWDDMTAQLRNWMYYTWLSGDHIVEQAIHSIDKMAWVMKDEPPVKCVGNGGRAARPKEGFGHIFDHHAVVYEYKSGVKLFHSTRQQNNTKQEVSDFVYGTAGSASIVHQDIHKIVGKRPFQKSARRTKGDDMYQNEHDELFRAIRANKPINDGQWMTRSTLMGIMGRMATYTGKEITWKMAEESKEDLFPQKLEFGPMPEPKVAVPGVTEYK
ncbi:MAG: Gfo/Idh/MocA family oxidoreductase [Gemmataceae bacterium]|nr:Gfo/Idh/MocA family oxidoreductase [Gemmataceae bacterium]